MILFCKALFYKDSQRLFSEGRSEEDALKFAVAAYHGMKDFIKLIQDNLEKEGKSDLHWAPIEAKLREGASSKRLDDLAYIYEVVR